MKDIIQIAGIIDEAEARMLVECGVNYLGFPLRLDVNAEDLSESAAATIIRSLAPPTRAVLVTYLDVAREISSLCQTLGVPAVQLHGDISAEELQSLKRVDPTLYVIKSLIVKDDNVEALKTIVRDTAPMADAFITDSFDRETGARGATGKTHDWQVSRSIVECSPRPVILAGGLTPENVGAAIRMVRPAGVDAHTGVEGADGRKIRRCVEAFVSEARDAFSSM